MAGTFSRLPTGDKSKHDFLDVFDTTSDFSFSSSDPDSSPGPAAASNITKRTRVRDPSETERAVREIIYESPSDGINMYSPPITAGYADSAYIANTAYKFSVNDSGTFSEERPVSNTFQRRPPVFLKKLVNESLDETYMPADSESSGDARRLSFDVDSDEGVLYEQIEQNEVIMTPFPWVHDPSSPSSSSTKSYATMLPPPPLAYSDHDSASESVYESHVSFDEAVEPFKVYGRHVHQERSAPTCLNDSIASSVGVPSKRARYSTPFSEDNDDHVPLPVSRAIPEVGLSKGGISPYNSVPSDIVAMQELFSNEMCCNLEFGQEIYDTLRERERLRPISAKFMSAQRLGATEGSRRNSVLSLLQKRTLFKMSAESLHLAVYIMDKCLDLFHVRSEKVSDLAAVSVTIATKMEEYHPVFLSAVIKAGVSSTTDKILLGKLEKRVLFEFDYMFGFPTPYLYANYFLSKLRSPAVVVQVCHHMLEMCLLASIFREFGGERVAHASVCLSHALYRVKDQSVRDVLRKAENELSVVGRIAVGSTHFVMREILNQIGMLYTMEEQFQWDQYSMMAHGAKLSSVVIPAELLKIIGIRSSMLVEDDSMVE